MQRKVASLAAENERQGGVIIGLEQMVEEAGTEKLQLLQYAIFPLLLQQIVTICCMYCHELELRALSFDLAQSNPPQPPPHPAHADSGLLLDLQQVGRCVC